MISTSTPHEQVRISDILQYISMSTKSGRFFFLKIQAFLIQNGKSYLFSMRLLTCRTWGSEQIVKTDYQTKQDFIFPGWQAIRHRVITGGYTRPSNHQSAGNRPGNFQQ
jgi:hypothetical protein